jgi:hypothetical protein
VRARGLDLDEFLELLQEERDVIIGNDRDAAAAAWTLAVIQCTLNRIFHLEEKHSRSTGDLISTPTRAPRSQQDWAQLALRETRLRNGTAVDQVGSMHTRHPRSTSLASSLAPHRHHKNRHKHVKESFHCQRKHKLPAHRCHHACSQASRPRSSLSHWQQTQKSGAIGPSSPIFLAFSA